MFYVRFNKLIIHMISFLLLYDLWQFSANK